MIAFRYSTVIILVIMSFSVFADKPDLSEKRIYNSKFFDIFISDVNCQDPGDCSHVQAVIIDKREKKKINASGETINIGFGRNLRGYVMYGNQYRFEIRQPETKLDEHVDLSKWSISVDVKNQNGTYENIFKDVGEMSY